MPSEIERKNSNKMTFANESAMSSLMGKGGVHERRIRDEMLSRSQHYRIGSKIKTKRHFKDVLRVKPCETKDHAVDYDAML